MHHIKDITRQYLAAYGIHNVSEIFYNSRYKLLFREEIYPSLEDF